MKTLYKNSVNLFKKNPNKIFFYSFDKKLNGFECSKYLNKICMYLKNKKISSIGIYQKNNIYWPLWYLAADGCCKDIYILNHSYSKNLINQIQKKYKINAIINNLENLENKNLRSINVMKFKKNFIKNKLKNNILFTSGTSDIPKGVIINENAYIHVARFLIKELLQKKDDLELLSMPFNHSFGLTRLRCVLLSGSSALITDGLKKFPEIYHFSKNFKITGLSLVPSGVEIIKNLLKNKVTNFSNNLRYFEIGSSVITHQTRLWLKKNFKKTNIIHHYGTTEASRSFIRSRGKKDNLKIANNWIGNNIGKVEYQISHNELYIKGKNLFFGYLDENTNKQFNGWFKTGDSCEIRNKKIFLSGRSDNQLNIGGQKVQAEYLENIIEKEKKILGCICYQIKDEILVNRIICLIEIKDKVKYFTIIKSLEKKFQNYPSYYKPSIFKLVEKLPKTFNGKKLRDDKVLIKY